MEPEMNDLPTFIIVIFIAYLSFLLKNTIYQTTIMRIIMRLLDSDKISIEFISYYQHFFKS